MNFIKGIVDGILQTDLEGNTAKSKYSYDPDDPGNDSELFSRNDGYKNRILSNDNVFISSSTSHLNEIYKTERENCLNGLVVRYGEGCVQQLSQVLKTNHETVLSLTNQYQNNLKALTELNNKVESAAVEYLKLRNENNNLSQQLHMLTSENASLKSQLAQAEITIKSNESHIRSLNDLLQDNKNTFNNIKTRFGEFYKLKSEIEDLKKQLSLAEGHVSMLKKERDEYWSDPGIVLNDEDYKRRIAQALERQDRAIAVAKRMASQPPSSVESEKVDLNDFKETEVDNKSLSELKLKVERLEDENTHLKEINDSLHTMYADLNKSMNEVKTSYLKESVDSLTSLYHTRTNPIQLVFIQPTGVLDLDFDPATLQQYSHETHSLPNQTSSHSPQTVSKPVQSSSHSFQGVSYSSQPTSQSFQASSHQGSDSSIKQAHRDEDRPKKASPKMNFRTKVIQYVTGLDPNEKPIKTANEQNLLDLNSPKVEPTSSSSDDAPSERAVTSLSSQTHKIPEKTPAASSWNSDWDFFDEVQTEPPQERDPSPRPESPPPLRQMDDSFDFILQEEENLSQIDIPVEITESLPNTPPSPPRHPTDSPTDLHESPSHEKNQETVEDVFDSIINEQDYNPPQDETTKSRDSVKAKKGWDDLDFDDEMFKE